ncbi:MAG TPA: tripartite tricarboxylate transporter substrate-binding protein [Beijerinckiaceae bacterium]|jgi:tripartite-type tricarboxylate transporter receptor subunit TctC
MSRVKNIILAVAAAALAAVAAAPSQAAGYYDGKTITLIVPNSPGGPMTQYARMLAPYLVKHLGARDMRVDNQPGAGSLRGTNVLWNAKPDGLTIAFTNVPTLIMAQLAGSPGVQFDAGKFTYLGSVADDPRVLVVNPKFNSIQDVMKLNREFIYPTQGTDEDFYTMAVLFDALGLKLKAVTGYQGDPDTSLAVIKGEGDGHMTSWATTAPSLKSKEKRPILNIEEKRYKDYPDVPAVTEIVKDEKKLAPIRTIIDILAVTRGFFGPPNMDPKAVADMRAGVAKALADPELIAESQKRALPVAFYSGESDQTRIQRIMQGSTSLTPILKAASASIK